MQSQLNRLETQIDIKEKKSNELNRQVIKNMGDITTLTGEMKLKCGLEEITSLNKNLQKYSLNSDLTLLEQKMNCVATLDNYHDLDLKIEFINEDLKKYLKIKEFEENSKKSKELLDETIDSRLSKDEFSKFSENLIQKIDATKDVIVKNKKQVENKFKTSDKKLSDLNNIIKQSASKNDITELANQIVSLAKKSELRILQDKIEPQISLCTKQVEK